MKSVQALLAACYSAACRPPTSGGTGGSIAGVGTVTRASLGGVQVSVNGRPVTLGAKPKVVNAEDSPHYQKRGDMRPVSEAEGREMMNWHKKTRETASAGRMPHDGDLVTVRANLDLLKVIAKRLGRPVVIQTLHQSSEREHKQLHTGRPGSVINYGVAFTLKDATFRVNQAARAEIAKGGAKFPMAGADGKFVSKPGRDMFDGVELRFNPKDSHVFVDPDGRPVKSAGEVTIAGTKVFARGRIEYYDASDYPEPQGGLPTTAILASLNRLFN